MKTRTVLLLFTFFTSAVVAQEKPGLYFTCAAADKYPTRIAYEILDANEQRLAVGFAEVQSPVDTAYVEVQLPERFMVQVYEDANRNDKLDRGLFTQPLERYDFSNKAWVFLGKPDLADALVQRQGAAHYLHFELKDVLD